MSQQQRIIKGKPEKKSFQGYKRNCHHTWSDNLEINVSTNKFIDFRKCMKPSCGAWKKKTTFYDTDSEFAKYLV